MTHESAMEVVTAIRGEVVAIVGICGEGTHPLTELLEKLEKGDINPEEAVEEATAIRARVPDFR